MFRQTTRYFAGLIGLYIIVAHGSQFGTVITAGAEGTANVTRALQGRS
jgi:hypothetical protein